MSSYPTYNPAMWVGGISTANYAALSDPANNEPLLNRAIDGLYTPGSTFKLNTATAALDLGLIDPGYLLRRHRHLQGARTASTAARSCIFHNSEGDGGFGEIDVSTALTVSSDDFFYNLGAMFWDDRSDPAYGDTPIQNQAAQYGLGELTGIDLPGEDPGPGGQPGRAAKLHAESPTGFPNTIWYTGDNVEMAFGQGATVITPIEQAVAYSTFANGGTRYAPQVAAAIVSPHGQGGQDGSPPRSPATSTCRRRPTRPCWPGSRAWCRAPAPRAPPTASPAWLNFPGGAGRQDRHRRHRDRQGAHGLVRGLRADRRPPVRGGLRHRPGRLRGHRRRPGGRRHLQLPGHPPGDRRRASPQTRAVRQSNQPVHLPDLAPTTTTTTAPGG